MQNARQRREKSAVDFERIVELARNVPKEAKFTLHSVFVVQIAARPFVY